MRSTTYHASPALKFVVFAVTIASAMGSAACAPASGQSAQARAPSAPEPVEPLVDDELDRTLKAEGLLGVLKRIDAELGQTLESDKFVEYAAAPSSRAKLAPVASFDDQTPVVTWGAPSASEAIDAPDVQR